MGKILPMLTTATWALGCVAAVEAGEIAKLPHSGTAKFQVSYVQWAPAREIALGEAAGVGASEFVGITRNVEGKGWFDRMTEHCVGQYRWGDGNRLPGSGTCLYLDADGDQVMVNWLLTAPYVGTKEVVGGTGKYLGITGKGTFAGTPLKASVHGMDLFVTDVTLDFNFSHTQ